MTTPNFRVARIITRLNIGGPAIQAMTLSGDLVAYGYDTRLLHGRASALEGDIRDVMSGSSINVSFIRQLVRPISPVKDLIAFWRLCVFLRRWKPHIVHTHMAKAGALGRLAAIVYNITAAPHGRTRVIHTYHGHVFEGYFGGPSTRAFLAVERWLGRRSDALIAISAEVARDLRDTYKIATANQLKVITLGFNLTHLLTIAEADRVRARQVLDIPAGTIVVTTVGRLTSIKHQSLFVSVAKRLAVQERARLVFLIVGDGELREELQTQVRQLEIESHVRFLGWRADLDTIYGATDVFVLTSRNEGTPVALIEAMAAGLPSVSTDVGGVRDVIVNVSVGALVQSDDADAVTREVSALVNDPSRREQIGRAARESVRVRYGAERLVRDIADLYGQLLTTSDTIQ